VLVVRAPEPKKSTGSKNSPALIDNRDRVAQVLKDVDKPDLVGTVIRPWPRKLAQIMGNVNVGPVRGHIVVDKAWQNVVATAQVQP
jgi:hypothetical protein